MKDSKDIRQGRIEHFTETVPRPFSAIKDRLPGVVVLPRFVKDKLTDGEVRVLLSWNGIDTDQQFHFEQLIGEADSPGPTVFSRSRIVRPSEP